MFVSRFVPETPHQNGTSPSPQHHPSVATSPVSPASPPSQNGSSPGGGGLRRPSGLMGPKVVVNKPGINVYRGRNAPVVTSQPSSPPPQPHSETGPQGDGQQTPLPTSPQPMANGQVRHPLGRTFIYTVSFKEAP